MNKTDADRLIYLPLDQAIYHEGICMVLKDRYWIYDPNKGLVLYAPNKKLKYASPQCNAQLEMAEMIRNKIYPNLEIKFVEMVTLPIDPKEYCY